MVLAAHYDAVSRWVFGLLAVFSVLARLSDLLIPGQEPPPTWFQPALAVMFAIAAFSSDHRAHWGAIGGGCCSLWMSAWSEVLADSIGDPQLGKPKEGVEVTGTCGVDAAGGGTERHSERH